MDESLLCQMAPGLFECRNPVDFSRLKEQSSSCVWGPRVVMKAKLPVGLLLGLLVFASIDMVPDPPAIRSHVSSAAILTHQVSASEYIDSSQPCSNSSPVPFGQARWIARLPLQIPKAARDEMIVAGYAANPSPPLSA